MKSIAQVPIFVPRARLIAERNKAGAIASKNRGKIKSGDYESVRARHRKWEIAAAIRSPRIGECSTDSSY